MEVHVWVWWNTHCFSNNIVKNKIALHTVMGKIVWPLQWRHNGVSSHQLHDCLLNRLFRHRWKKSSKLCVTGLCVRRGIHRWLVNSPHKGPVTRKMFPFDDAIMLPALCEGNQLVTGVFCHNLLFMQGFDVSFSVTYKREQAVEQGVGIVVILYVMTTQHSSRWLCARLQQFQCISNGVAAVLHYNMTVWILAEMASIFP